MASIYRLWTYLGLGGGGKFGVDLGGNSIENLARRGSSMHALKSVVLNAFNILPTKLKNSLFHLSFNIARPEFDRFAHLYAHAPNMEAGLNSLARRGLNPTTVIDVGAFEGNWSRMARRVWPNSQIVMFEPNSKKTAVVSAVSKELAATLFHDLLGASDGIQVTFNVMESGSSIMNENSPLERTKEKRELRRMDTAIQSIKGRALLKIDAQGYEIEILKGAEKLLPSVDAILLEVAVIQINEGAPILHEVVVFMKSIDFVACEILEIHRRPLDQALNQFDILFVREDSVLLADKRHFSAADTQANSSSRRIRGLGGDEVTRTVSRSPGK
jgi:FkbM family methyltransferase